MFSLSPPKIFLLSRLYVRLYYIKLSDLIKTSHPPNILVRFLIKHILQIIVKKACIAHESIHETGETYLDKLVEMSILIVHNGQQRYRTYQAVNHDR